MSTVRYFGDVPHIVRYGMQDDKKARGWMLFWRNGVRFEISVAGIDIEGTPFVKTWTEKNQEPKTVGAIGHAWLKRWEDLCDCIISQSLKLLEELAPEKVYWTTLRDYLYTPGYELKMVTSQTTGDAEPEIVKGPETSPAYEMEPIPIHEVGNLPPNLVIYTSEELTIIEKEQDWRRPPRIVRTPEGHAYKFKRIDKSSMFHDTGKVINWSLDKVRLHIKLRIYYDSKNIKYPSRLPRMIGIVTDNGPKSDNNKTADTSTAADTQEAYSTEGKLIAGILQDLFPGSRSLWDMVRDRKDDPSLTAWINQNSEDWKTQTLAIVQEVHNTGIYWGGTDDNEERTMFNINQHCIHTDDKNKVWLNPSAHFNSGFMVLDNDQDEDNPSATTTSTETAAAVGSSNISSRLEQGKATDLQAIEKLFGEWLPTQMSKH